MNFHQKRPFFSVILTTFNRARLVTRALQSLLKQTETDWEAIIIDDGSTDNTRELVIPYLQRKNISYFPQENKGFIQAKNVGIQKAQGRYLTFLDSDDEYALSHLTSRRNILDKETAIDLLHGGVKIIGEEFVPDSHHPHRKIHLSECAISGTFFIRPETMRLLHGFAGSALTTDADFMERARKRNLQIVKTTIPTYIYHRDNEVSITKNLMKNRLP